LKLFDNFDPKRDLYDRIFICLLALGFFLRIIWLDKPEGSLIFDEKYYVNVARIILRLPHDPDIYEGATLGLDPNQEHPFLAKGIIALSISLLGDNAWGWRIPSVILGTLSIFLFYLLIKKISNKNELALLSAFLMTFSNLIFIHSRIATLDIFMLFLQISSF
jgi:4-amino-4-deoxy-L-arabinose transferase-like glycosyltransferase